MELSFRIYRGCSSLRGKTGAGREWVKMSAKNRAVNWVEEPSDHSSRI